MRIMRQPLWLYENEIPQLPDGWRMLRTEDACIQLKPGKLFETKTVSNIGAVPVLNQSEEGFLGYHDEVPGVEASRENPVVTFANHTCALRLMKTPFSSIQNVFPKVGIPELVDTTFFYYAVRGRVGFTDYKGHHPLFRQMFIPVPPLQIQRRIAGILSAYDELIANNQRRIAVLEQMARALYREWFVHFRAPGVVMKEGDELPEEWEVKRLGEVADSVRSSVAKGEIHEAVPFLGLEHIPRRSLALDAWEYTTELGSSKLQFQKGDILFGKIRPYFHKVSVAPFSGLCSADTIVIRSKRSEHFALVTCLASSDEFVAHASATANGAKMPRADWKVLKNFHVRVAPPAVLEKFSAFVMPAIEQMQTLVFQNVNLRRTRDLLLPRLMSGRVELDLQLETDGSFQR